MNAPTFDLSIWCNLCGGRLGKVSDLTTRRADWFATTQEVRKILLDHELIQHGKKESR